MDLDEEGRTGLGFWGLGRREWDGKWREKKKKEREKEQRKKIVNRKSSLKDSSSTWIFCPPQPCQHTEIESLILDLLQ